MSLRILIVPYCAAIDLFSSSDIRDMYVLAQGIMKLDDSVQFLFAIPDRVPRHSLPKHDRLHWVHYKQNFYSYTDESHELSGNFLELFNQRIGNFQIDLIWTTRSQLAGYLYLMAHDARCSQESLPVVVHELMPVSSQNIIGKNRIDVMARAMSYLAGWPLFLSDVEKEHAIRLVSRFCSGSLSDEIRQRAQVMTPGQDVEQIVETAKGIKKPDPMQEFRLLHAGRLNANKRVPDILRIYEYIRASGVNTTVTICTADKKEKKYATLYEICPHLDLKVSLQRQSYYEELCRHHVFVVNSVGESLCNSWVEKAMAGVVPVLRADAPYTDGFLGPLAKSYPFKWKTLEEAYAVLLWIREHWSESQAILSELQVYLSHQAKTDTVALWLRNYMAELVESAEETYSWGGNGTWKQPMETALALMPDAFDLDDFMRMFRLSCKHVSNTDIKNPFFQGVPSKWGAYKYLRASGIVRDDMTRPRPLFRRVSIEKGASKSESDDVRPAPSDASCPA